MKSPLPYNFFLFAFVLLSGIATGTYVSYTLAQGIGITQPFGGLNITTPCECTPGAFHTIVGPPRPGILVFQAGVSIPYREFQFAVSGVWSLQNAIPGAICMMPAIPTCIPKQPPATHTITIEGTSFPGGGLFAF